MNNEENNKDKEKIKLIAYFAFFLIVVLMVFIAGPNDKESPKCTDNQNTNDTKIVEEKKEEEVSPYLEKQQLLISGNYKYKYVITGSVNYIYIGERKGNVNEGYRESDENVIKYRETNEQTLQIHGNVEEEYNDLYLGLDANLFDFPLLFDKLNASNSMINRETDINYYNYENIDNYNIKVYVNDKNIEKMVINNETINYEFTFEY